MTEPTTEAGRALSERVSRLCDSADVWLDSESDRPYMDVTDEMIVAIEQAAVPEQARDTEVRTVMPPEDALRVALHDAFHTGHHAADCSQPERIDEWLGRFRGSLSPRYGRAPEQARDTGGLREALHANGIGCSKFDHGPDDHALDERIIHAALSQGAAHEERGLDVERIREDEATWGFRCTGCGRTGHNKPYKPCCPDCEHVSYFATPEAAPERLQDRTDPHAAEPMPHWRPIATPEAAPEEGTP